MGKTLDNPAAGLCWKVKVIEARPVFVFETASHQSSSCLPFGTQSE